LTHIGNPVQGGFNCYLQYSNVAGLLSCSVPAVLCATATPVSAVAFLQSNLQELHQPDAEGEKAYVIQPGSSVATALSEGVPT
jgi:hypothetical protein